jgi:hypothetical protein
MVHATRTWLTIEDLVTILGRMAPPPSDSNATALGAAL